MKGEIPKRILGRTGQNVTILGLGGEGVLRTYGRMKEAVPVIHKALDLGINYFDTAPAYSQSQDYYGAALGERRKEIFLASKTHERSHGGSLKLLEDSLKRIKTDHLDLWQLHDLRSMEDLDEIFDEKNGAIRALEEARAQKMVRFFGITGHHDPKILMEALRRYSFDTLLVAMNAADRKHASRDDPLDRHSPHGRVLRKNISPTPRRGLVPLSFIDEVLPIAQKQNVGIIGMKVLARGQIVEAGISIQEALNYVWTLPLTTCIVGCATPEEVEENVGYAKVFSSLSENQMRELEKKAAPYADELTSYKK